MSWEGWFTLVVLVGTVLLLARERLSTALAVLGADILLLVTGVISVEQAFSGFGNSAPITVAALYVLARAVEKTGALRPIVSATLGDGQSRRGSLLRLMLPSAAASAFLNNTPIVAMMAPQITAWAERRGLSPSRYLMPLSFAVILGGVITVIGTSTNLVVSGLLEAHGMAPIGMFEITWIGLPVAITGIGILMLTAPVVLPDRRSARSELESEFREFVVSMQVIPGGPLDGVTVAGGGLRHLQGVYLTEIQRGAQHIAPIGPTDTLRGGDRLTFVGRVDQVVDLQHLQGLSSAEQHHALHFNDASHGFFEAVVGPSSPLVGRTLKEVGFRERFQAAVLAIHRAGERVAEKLGDVRLQAGDTLLLLSDPGFGRRWRERPDFLVISRLGGTLPVTGPRAVLVGLVTLAIVGVAGLGLLPILQASLLGALVLVGAGVLTPGEARNAIDLDVIVVIAASFGLGAAIESSGLADVLAGGVVGAFDTLGPTGVLLGITLAVVALTDMITNNAAAALLFPIAIATAAELGVDPRPFVMAVTIGASCSFLTPIGYQTNMMVYGPGGYRFGDFARLGAPLTLTVIVAVVVLAPLIWPF